LRLRPGGNHGRDDEERQARGKGSTHRRLLSWTEGICQRWGALKCQLAATVDPPSSRCQGFCKRLHIFELGRGIR
jgi:hypothetical protein